MGRTIIDHLHREHDQLRGLLHGVEDTPASRRGDLFARILALLARHEAAERALVHPRTRGTPQGNRVADSLLREEQHLEELLARMQGMDTGTEGFLNALRQLRASVLDHVRHEEATEFPRLADTYSTEELEVIARRFERFGDIGPTRPHPHTPNDGLSQRLVAPVAGAVDRVRDAVRHLLH